MTVVQDEGTVLRSLHEVLSQNLASIEIIPGDWRDWTSSTTLKSGVILSPSFPFLLVEGNLGIPQKVLQRLYLASSTFSRTKPVGSEDVETILQQTASVVMVNPAHQTALNTRKRLILQNEHMVNKELHFVELLLQGVKACAKETALWAHRRWCLNFAGSDCTTPQSYYPPAPASALFIDSIPSSLTGASARIEFAVARRAYTLYPRNYHAWTHWRYTFDACCEVLVYPDITEASREDFSRVVVDEFRELRRWIDGHTTDSSAIHHLLTSLTGIRQLLSSRKVGKGARGELEVVSSSSELAKQAWRHLSSSQPPRESAWIYIQSLLPHLPAEERARYVEDMSILDIPWQTHRRHFLSFYQSSSLLAVPMDL